MAAIYSLDDALALGPVPAGSLAIPILNQASMTLKLYTPTGTDEQQPHSRDELYFVARGNAEFSIDGHTHQLEVGACQFVPANVPHRFTQFSSDFAVWVVFYGPEGGDN